MAKKDETLVEEQQGPVGNDGRPIWDLVIEDMRRRDDLGRQRYGTPLQAGNGRRPLVDLYQELLDATVYARQEIEERRHLAAEIVERAAAIVEAAMRAYALGRGGINHEAALLAMKRAAADIRGIVS